MAKKIWSPMEIVQMMADTITMPIKSNISETPEQKMWKTLFQDNEITKVFKITGEIKSITNYQTGYPYTFTKITGVEPKEEFEIHNELEQSQFVFNAPSYEENQDHIAILSDYILRAIFHSSDLATITDEDLLDTSNNGIRKLRNLKYSLENLTLEQSQEWKKKNIFYSVTEFLHRSFIRQLLEFDHYGYNNLWGQFEIPITYVLENDEVRKDYLEMNRIVQSALSISLMYRVYYNISDINISNEDQTADRVFTNLCKWVTSEYIRYFCANHSSSNLKTKASNILELPKVLLDLAKYFARTNFKNESYTTIIPMIYNKFYPFFMKEFVIK